MKIEDIPIENLPNTSFITIRKFKSLGINTYFDLLNYFPYRYENYSLISPVNKLQEGEIVTVIGHIVETKQQITRRGFRLQFFKLADDTGVVELTFYNQSYLLTILKKGMKVAIAGQVKKFGRKLTIEPKEYEIVNSHLIHTGRLVPIYPEKRGLSSRTIREKMYFILDTLRVSGFEEIFPKEIISYNNLIDEQTAYQKIHFPENLKTAEKAKQRLAFNELFLIQLSSQLVKKEWKKEKVGNKFMLNKMNVQLIDRFKDSLPFKLTNAQKRVWDEIRSDLLKTVPMNRFLQGEVGSGKTVIAALACYLAHLNGYQSLFMAPTEILAQQHYNTITSLFKKFQIRNPK